MRPLDSTGILLQGVRSVLTAASRRADIRSSGPRSADVTPHSAFASPPARTGSPVVSRSAASLSTTSPQTIIRQAELLLQITAAAASSPALREIAAAAYRMEIDARREMARARLEGMTAGRQWFA